MPEVVKITRLFLCLSETSLLENMSGFLAWNIYLCLRVHIRSLELFFLRGKKSASTMPDMLLEFIKSSQERTVSSY